MDVKSLFKITFVLLLFLGCSSEEKNWYPFPNSFFGNLYTAGPIALTSNISQDKEIWNNIDDLNSSLARMSYAMQLGVRALHCGADDGFELHVAPS